MTKNTPTARSTKQEILSAYEELIQELEQRDEKSTVTVSSSASKNVNHAQTVDKPKDVIARLGEVRVQINSNLGKIVDQLVTESENLEQMRAQAQTLQEEIEQIYQIKVQASTLQNLITLKQEAQQTLDKEMQEQRAQWAAEQERQKQLQQESSTDQAKQRKRAEEEYMYALNVARQKEADAYEIKRRQAEAALKTREEKLAMEENTRQDLQKRVAELEKQLVTEAAKIRKETEDRVTRDLQTTYTLEMKGIEGERLVSNLTIKNLEKVIQSQESEVKDLKAQLIRATQQIKDIAVSVIETQKPSKQTVPTAQKTDE